MNIVQDLNIEYLKCHHGVDKRLRCQQCKKEEANLSNYLLKKIREQPRRIPIRRGCSAPPNGGCFCTGACQEIIGYRDPVPGELNRIRIQLV